MRLAILLLLMGVLTVTLVIAENPDAHVFTQEEYLESLNNLQLALNEYTAIMDKVREQTPDTVKEVTIKVQKRKSFTGFYWEMQHIGYPNRLRSIRGYVLTLREELLKTKLDLLALKGPSRQELNRLQQELSEVRKELRDLNQTEMAD